MPVATSDKARTVRLKHPILTPRGMIASLVIRAPSRDELDAMEIAAGAVLDGVAVPLAEALEDELVGSSSPAGRFRRKPWTRTDHTGRDGGADPGLVELVAVLSLIGAMNGVDPAVLTKLTDEDLASVSQALDTVMRGAMNQIRSA